MARVVLDTTVLIDHLRGNPAAGAWLAGLDAVPVCSELTRVEIMRGLRASERRAAERLMAGLRWQSVTTGIASTAGDLGRKYVRSHRHIGVVDLVVAATAETLDLSLATSNVEHYPMFHGLRPPY